MPRFGIGNQAITKPKMVLVEGKDEAELLPTLVEKLGLGASIHVAAFDGIKNLSRALDNLRKAPGYSAMEALGIIRDADEDRRAAFASVCGQLEQNGFAWPEVDLQTCGEKPRVSVLILPHGEPRGNLEDVCLASVYDDPAMVCVERFFACLKEKLPELPGTHIAKAQVKAFLVSRELLEESHFRFLQDRLETWVPAMPVRPSVEKVHAFLASRYNPRLTLGMAAKKGYWNLEHPAFNPLKTFLRSL